MRFDVCFAVRVPRAHAVERMGLMSILAKKRVPAPPSGRLAEIICRASSIGLTRPTWRAARTITEQTGAGIVVFSAFSSQYAIERIGNGSDAD